MVSRAVPVFFGVAALALVLVAPITSYAQAKALDIAQRYFLNDESFAFGDIVIYDRELLTYRLSQVHGDSNIFGVVVENPPLLLDDGTENAPIVRNGESVVNVVATNGPIQAGDYITTSNIKGKGEKANPDDAYLVGIALASYTGSPSELAGIEAETPYGKIPILLSIGHVSKIEETITGSYAEPDDTSGITEATLLNVIQYIIAGFIGVGSIFIAFRNFGSNIREGVVSIGRNPMAKTSIQSAIVLNVVLIVLVSAGGLVISLIILLLPI